MTSAKRIEEAFRFTNTDKGYTHKYFNGYASLFKDVTPGSILEIGIKQGRSLLSWKWLFPSCNITGIDISDEEFRTDFLTAAESKNIICDATKPEVLQYLDDSYDVIIDDGSHYYKDILSTFDLLKDRFNYAYVIEDTMYGNDFLEAYCKSLGFKVARFQSYRKQNIPVNTGWLLNRVRSVEMGTTLVSLELIIITK